ncbi:MAG: aminopeptidase P family N-terminal domain-containing protein [Dehalococcoidales bacterium]|nr:aminopeptidase P family N-terminal domain-containing protein [Dehalococcoidales bacterium]
MQIEARIEKVRKHLTEKQIEALLISQPENLFYLTGCEGLEGYILIDQKKMIIITDFRYIEQVQRQLPQIEIFQIKGKMSDWFPALFSNLNIRYLGFESHHLSYALFEQINSIIKKSALNLNPVPVEGVSRCHLS